jgi:hypothetical protein
MAMSEPPQWTKQRTERLKQQYSEFQAVDPSMYIPSDLRSSQINNAPLTEYTQSVLNLNRYARQKANE